MFINRLSSLNILCSSFVCFTFLALILSVGCGYFEEEEKKYVLSVGSKDLTVMELKKEMEFMTSGLETPARQMEMIRDKLLERIIDHYLILEYAEEEDLSITEKEFQKELKEIKKDYSKEAFNEELLRGYVSQEEWEARFKEQLLVKKVIHKVLENVTPPTYEAIKEYYEKHLDEFTFPEMVKFRQIVTETKKEADDLLRRIKSGEDMGELARQHSIAPEAESAGVVGWLARENLHESMADVLFSLSQNEISKIVKTPYGYHIFQVLDSRSEGVRGLPEVKDKIESIILAKKHDAFFQEWLKSMRSKYKVYVNRELFNEMEIN